MQMPAGDANPRRLTAVFALQALRL